MHFGVEIHLIWTFIKAINISKENWAQRYATNNFQIFNIQSNILISSGLPLNDLPFPVLVPSQEN